MFVWGVYLFTFQRFDILLDNWQLTWSSESWYEKKHSEWWFRHEILIPRKYRWLVKFVFDRFILNAKSPNILLLHLTYIIKWVQVCVFCCKVTNLISNPRFDGYRSVGLSVKKTILNPTILALEIRFVIKLKVTRGVHGSDRNDR